MTTQNEREELKVALKLLENVEQIINNTGDVYLQRYTLRNMNCSEYLLFVRSNCSEKFAI
jgi:hypothetical protein